MHPSAIVWKRLTNGPIAMHTYEARTETLVSLRLPRLRTQDSEPPPNAPRITRERQAGATGANAAGVTDQLVGCIR